MERQEEKVFIQQPEWIVHSQMTIELLVDGNIKDLPLCCHTTRNNNPVDICMAMSPKIGKLESIKYRIFCYFFPFLI